MPQILELRKGKELLFRILHKIMELMCFSYDVHQCNITDIVVRVQLCFQMCLILYYYYIFSCLRFHASGWFVRMDNVHPVLTKMFKNIFRTFKVETSQVYPQP